MMPTCKGGAASFQGGANAPPPRPPPKRNPDCVVELNEYSFIYNQDETQHRNADYIAAMEQRMKDMEREEEELISTC